MDVLSGCAFCFAQNVLRRKTVHGKQSTGLKTGGIDMTTIDTQKRLHLGMQYFADAADSQDDDNQESSAQKSEGTKGKDADDGLPKSQEELNAIIEKRLKRERKKMEHQQQTGTIEGQHDGQTAEQSALDTSALDAVNRDLMIARAQLEAYKSGVIPNAVEDAVYLAVMQAEKAGEMDEDGIRDALKEVLKRRPEWRAKKEEDEKSGFKVGVDTSESREKARGKGLPKGKVIF